MATRPRRKSTGYCWPTLPCGTWATTTITSRTSPEPSKVTRAKRPRMGVHVGLRLALKAAGGAKGFPMTIATLQASLSSPAPRPVRTCSYTPFWLLPVRVFSHVSHVVSCLSSAPAAWCGLPLGASAVGLPGHAKAARDHCGATPAHFGGRKGCCVWGFNMFKWFARDVKTMGLVVRSA